MPDPQKTLRLPLLRRVVRSFHTQIILLGTAGFLLRIPALDDEKGSYLFCDEWIFYGDVLRMIEENSLSSSEFRSGPMNVYPMFLIVLLLGQFIDLSSNQILLLGRLLLPVLLGAATAIVTGYAARILSRSHAVSLVSAGLVAFSPGVISINRIWYPDHYIAFFAAISLLLAGMIVRGEPGKLLDFLFGCAVALTVAVKYTAFPVVLMAGLVYGSTLWREASRLRSLSAVRSSLGAIMSFGFGFVALLVITHLNSLLKFDDWVAAQSFNSRNYGGFAPNFIQGTLAYGLVLFVLMFGLIGLIGLWAGIVNRFKNKDYLVLTVLLAPALFSIGVLGTQEMFVNRNVMPVVPLIAVLMAFGLVSLWKKNLLAVRAILLCLVSLQIWILIDQVHTDMKIDSREMAEEWIRENIPRDAIVGIGNTCSGPSPAEIANYSTRVDPSLEEGLEYYVLDSYWSNAITNNFRGKNAEEALWNQRYLHFYYFSDKNLWRGFSGFFQDTTPSLPEGYDLIAEFRENGPVIWVLGRSD